MDLIHSCLIRNTIMQNIKGGSRHFVVAHLFLFDDKVDEIDRLYASYVA